MAYHGARIASLGTSPIAMAVPSGNGPIVLDMAASTISNGRILQSRASGAELPQGTALTTEGEPTTDPRRAEILLPLGGPKGSGLGLMFEMLASVLAAAPVQARVLGPEKRTRHTSNMVIIAVEIESFRPLGDFTSDADTLTALIKALPRQAGFDEIFLPGERVRPHRNAAPQIRHSDRTKLWEELEGIAKANAIKMRSDFPPR